MAVVECPSCGTLLEFVADDEALAVDPLDSSLTPVLLPCNSSVTRDPRGTVDWIDTLLGSQGYYWTTLTATKSH